MSAFIDDAQSPRDATRKANLGTADEESIFASFDTADHPALPGLPQAAPADGIAAQCAVLASSLRRRRASPGRSASWSARRSPTTCRCWNGASLLFGVLAVLTAAAQFLDNAVTSRLAQRVIFDVRRAMFAHFQDVALTFMDKTHVGRIMSRLQGDVNALQEFLESSTGALGDFTTLVGYAVVLLALDWRLGLLTLATLPALIGIRAIWLPYSKETFRRARDASSIANGALAENINGVRTVQETRREALNFELYEEKARENFEAQVGSAWLAQMMTPTVDVLTGVAMACVIVVGGDAVLGGALKVGVLVTFILSVQRFFEPVRLLSMQYTVMQRAMAAGHRIFEVLDVPVTVSDSPDAVTLEKGPTPIEPGARHLRLRPRRDRSSTTHPRRQPKEVVALVGPTGSGKTTIAALVHRFYDVVEEGAGRRPRRARRDAGLPRPRGRHGAAGPVPVHRHDRREHPLQLQARRRTRSCARPRPSPPTSSSSAFPHGYDTPVGQRGRNLSVGQRQLVSFARALVADPSVLILDEATANIDSFTEQAIQKALKVLFAGRTCLIIAHRLATVRDADRIIVLQNGRIVEQGPHTALMARWRAVFAALRVEHGLIRRSYEAPAT